MKTGIFLAAALVHLAAAQPHRNPHGHQHVHEKKDVVVTDVQYVTATGGNVIVYVNGAGVPVSTVTQGQAAATQAGPAPVNTEVVSSAAPAPAPAPETTKAAAPAPASAKSSAAPAPAPASAKSSAAPAPAPASAQSSAAPAPLAAAASKVANVVAAVASPSSDSSSSSSSSSNGGKFAIAYSPYDANGDCKTQDQVNSDFDQLNDYYMVRIYGTDCNQVTTVGNAAKAKGMKLFAGIFDINAVQSEAQTIIDAANGDFSHIDTISVGNELVNSGQASPEQVIAALSQARSQMNAAGYTGKMVTVDTFNAIIANPSLCQASDFAAANAHSFFDPSIVPAGAGVWATATALAVKFACGGKDTVITESGFPSAGDCNGSMCPSEANQQTVISQLKSAFPDGGLILFSAYNDLWKTNTPATFMAEQSYGIYGNAPASG